MQERDQDNMTTEEKIEYLTKSKLQLKSGKYNIEDIIADMPEELCKEFYIFILDVLMEESKKKEDEINSLSRKK